VISSLDELKLRIVVAIETVTPQILESIWEIEYRLDILRAMKDAHIKVALHSAALILKAIKYFEFFFHIL
jgi:hypothetical protein